jgi:hypothetical protein
METVKVLQHISAAECLSTFTKLNKSSMTAYNICQWNYRHAMTLLWRVHGIVSPCRTTPAQQVCVGSFCSAGGLKNQKSTGFWIFVNFMVFQIEFVSKI